MPVQCILSTVNASTMHASAVPDSTVHACTVHVSSVHASGWRTVTFLVLQNGFMVLQKTISVRKLGLTASVRSSCKKPRLTDADS